MDNPFGVLEFLHWNHPWNKYKYPGRRELERAAALMKEAGVGWLRLDFLWGEIEPSPKQFDFSKYDEIVEVVRQAGIQILGILGYSASWAASGDSWNYPPKDDRLFADYALATIGHFRGKVDHWEVWNEPDSRTYWAEQDGLKRYCQLLKQVYLTAKAAYPHCKILNGGFANGAASINHLYDNGAKGYFDILNIHIFESPLNKGSIKGVVASAELARKIMVRNGDVAKNIWVTEIGSPGVPRGRRVANWWIGENPNEQQQAAWVKEVYANLLKLPAIEKVFWAFLRDCDKHWDNGVDYFGLVRWDFSPKPSFKVYRKLANQYRK